MHRQEPLAHGLGRQARYPQREAGEPLQILPEVARRAAGGQRRRQAPPQSRSLSSGRPLAGPEGDSSRPQEPPPVGEAAEGRWGEFSACGALVVFPPTPPTDRCAIASPHGGRFPVMGIEPRPSPAFVEKSPTNSTPYNFLIQFNQTRSNRLHNQSRPRHGEGSWYRPKRGEDRIERGRKKVSGRRDRVCPWIDPGPCEPFLDKLAGRQGRDRQTGLTGSAEAAAGSPRGYWSCPSVGQPGPGLKQHPRLRPSGITTRRSGRRSRNAKQTHGPRAPPGRSAPPRPNACERGSTRTCAQPSRNLPPWGRRSL